MTDRDFLIWLHERLENVHKENAHLDYMHKLRAIIKAMPADKVTPNMSAYNSLHDLRRDLGLEELTMKLTGATMKIFECRYERENEDKHVIETCEFIVADNLEAVAIYFTKFCHECDYDLKLVQEVLTVVRDIRGA
jgi:hypothetical protein